MKSGWTDLRLGPGPALWCAGLFEYGFMYGYANAVCMV